MITILTLALLNTVLALTVIIAIDKKKPIKKDDFTSEIGVLITDYSMDYEQENISYKNSQMGKDFP